MAMEHRKFDKACFNVLSPLNRVDSPKQLVANPVAPLELRSNFVAPLYAIELEEDCTLSLTMPQSLIAALKIDMCQFWCVHQTTT